MSAGNEPAEPRTAARRRVISGLRRRMRQFRRRHSYSASVEEQVKQLRSTLGTDLRRLHDDVERLNRTASGHDSQLAALRQHADELRSGVAELQRRPVVGRPPPPRVLTAVTEQNPVLAGLVVSGRHARVVLVLNGFAVDQIFAGVRTALVAAVELARRLHRPLALTVLEPLGADPAVVRAGLAEWLVSELDAGEVAEQLTISAQELPRRADMHPDDIWLVTYWTTALQVARLCEDGLLTPSRVVYLMQDWEPGFYPWGTEFALASSTYSAGFHLLVNSSSLAGFATEQTGVPTPDEQIFAPQLDETRLRAAATAWTPGEPGRPRLLYYARPSKPRNLYALGLAALRRWAEDLPEAVRPIVTFAGEAMPDADLGAHVTVRTAGKVTFEAYYDLLAQSDVGLALMYSPHPSHLALELPMAGIPTITNSLGSHRRPWVAGLDVVAPTPEALAAALTRTVASLDATEHRFEKLVEPLGHPLTYCLDALVDRLTAHGPSDTAPNLDRGAGAH